MIGIYKITSPTGKVYIGQSINIKKRQREYSRLQSCKNQTKLYASLIKYGYTNHTFEVVEECLLGELNIRERYWQEYYNVLDPKGLTLRLTKAGDRSGRCSREVAEKIGNSNRGKVKPPRTVEHKQHLSAALAGRTPSIEHKENLRKARLGKSNSDKSKQLSSKRWQSEGNPNARKVRDCSTGEVFPTVVQAANKINIKPATLRSWLAGVVTNKSTMEFVD